jgi:hypothetical protein
MLKSLKKSNFWSVYCKMYNTARLPREALLCYAQANALDLFRAQFRWLLLEDPELPRTQEVLPGLNLLLDSDVVIGCRISETSFRLFEVYKRGPYESLVWSETGTWQPDTAGVQPTSPHVLSVRRTNIHKSVLKAVMVVRLFGCHKV